MRIILTSATVAILLRNGSNVSSASTVSSTRILTVSQGRDDKTQLEYSKNESFQKKRVVQDRFSMSKSGDECNSFVSNEEKTGESNLEPDIGILSCSLSNQECLRDTTSSIGGRCFDRRPRDTSQVIESPIFRRRHRAMEKETSTLHTTVNHVHQTPRFLQDEKFACQANCPEDFCNCARNNYYGAKCANEMNDVCVAELLPECVPTDYVYYYEETYCKFASCIISERNYWDCECEAYRNYCNLYYMYAESQAACEVADCCDNTKEGDDRASCIPITFAPTATPDSDSSMTSMPTDSPSVVKDSAIPSSLPSTSEPSNSSTTASPSKSPLALPFTSSSTLPSSSPSLTPSILLASSPPSSVPSSADPSYSPTTGTPTKSPSALPTFFPLFLPTSALPSASLESNRPTEAPTISVTSTNSPFPSVETFLSTSLPESSSFTSSTPPTFHPTGSSYTTEQTESNAASTPRAPTKSPIKESTQSRTEAKSTEVPSQPPDEDSDGLLFPPTTEIDVNSSQFTYGSYAWIATFCTSFGGTMLLLSW